MKPKNNFHIYSRVVNPVIILIAIVNIFIAWSCKKFIEVQAPQTELVETIVFQNDQSSVSAMLGVYSKMNAATINMFCGGTSLFAGLSADELINSTASSTYDPFSKNALLSNNTSIGSRFWSHAYPIVYHCNAMIEGLEQSHSLTENTKKQLKGEAKLVRAFIYFNLLQLFGNVPLVLSTDYRINALMPRTSAEVIYKQITDDLTEAAQLLPITIINANGRPNKWAAKALLARVYLYQKKYQLAESEASDVINSGLFSIVANPNDVFLINSPETIWQIMPVGTAQINAPEGNIFIPSSSTARPSFGLTPILLNSFESNDKRKTNWTKSVTVNSQLYTYPYKYKVRTNATVTEANILLRLSEQYLIRAEARAHQDKITGSNSAETDLNIIRARAGLSNITASSLVEIMSALEKERQTELFAEWGHRWFDLKRWGSINTVLSVNKSPNWNETDSLWPLPISELNFNSQLVQNPGY